MALTPGSKLGSYEVLSLLGTGGMGEVYRARDTRLGREVAIKVLPADRMADEGRRQRFVQEARAASALNHPNIVTIYEVESAEGIDFIVMEYVPGKSLDLLIPRQGMRVSEVLRVAIPMADALARAHARGIVHRDLKPANVVVSTEGVVKVLDFGLAKLVAGGEVNDDQQTVTREAAASPLSHPGTVAGTAGYMSPEQATAGKVDSRSDVFSFGAVLYEMVTGQRAFAGSSTAETLAAVVRVEPKAPSEVVAGVPKDLDRLIRRCLQKDLDRRFQHMVDVKVELNEIKEESDSQPAVAPAARRRRRWWLEASLGIALLLAAMAFLWWRPGEGVVPSPRLESLTSLRGSEMYPTFSPDGRHLAFAWEGEKGGNWDIYLKMVGSTETRRLTTAAGLDAFPSWSPDGRHLAFVRTSRERDDGTIHLVSPVGGSDRKVSEFPVSPSQLSWSPDTRWLAAARFSTTEDATQAGIYLIPVLGGEPRRITTAKGLAYHLNPAFSPDGRHLAYVSGVGTLARHVDVVDLGGDYSPIGPARRLTRRAGWLRGLAWSRDGNSVIYGDVTSGRLWRAWIVGDRPPERIDLAGLGALWPAGAVSFDRLAFVQSQDNTDIYRFKEGYSPEGLLVSSFTDAFPSLSPNGGRIAFQSRRAGEGDEIWLASADGSDPSQLTRGPGISQGSPRWSPDGRRIAFDSQSEHGNWDIWTIGADGGSPSRLTLNPGDENMPSWSRDGRWVYFQSSQAGVATTEVWRVPAAGGAGEQVTHGGGSLAYESADGNTLLFMREFADAPLFALPLAGGPERKLLECVPAQAFAVSASGVYHLACGADIRNHAVRARSSERQGPPCGQTGRGRSWTHRFSRRQDDPLLEVGRPGQRPDDDRELPLS